MYAVVLSYAEHADARDISAAHRLVLTRVADALLPLVPGINLAGTSDLAFHQGDLLQKFSGNSLRCKRSHFLYHGTLLYDFDLDRVTKFLARPTREPVYRANRTHRAFLANLPATREQLITALARAWNASEPLTYWPMERMRELVKEIGRR
jgi:lipoate-protein ligase A